MSEIKCPCCGREVTDPAQQEAIKVMTLIVDQWNVHAAPAGFSKVEKLSLARARTLRAAIRERPFLAEWIRAIKAYVRDVERWPDRLKYGFDTFIRPSQRDKWFEEKPIDVSDKGEDYYLKPFRGG